MKRCKKNSLFPMVLLSLLLLILIIALASTMFKNLKEKEALTGGAVSTPAEGGNVTYANASKSDDSGFWQGYFGEITVDASASTPSSTARKGNVTELNLVLPCLGNEIYASTQNEISFGNMGAGTKEAVDTFLNLSSSHLESGSKAFTTTRDFVVSSTLITAIPTTFMKVSGSSDSPFALAVLNQSNILVFLSNVSLDTNGFDGNTQDYQMMVPVNQSELTYYFFSDCEAAAPVPAPGGGGVSAPSITAQTYSISQEQLSIGVIKELKQKDRIEFTLLETKHVLVMNTVSETQIVVTVSSEPQQKIIFLEEEAVFDLGEHDLLVRYLSYDENTKKAKIIIKEIKPISKPISVPIEEAPAVIEIIEKEGKLITTGYPIAITVLKGQKKTTTIEVSNIGEGKVTNVYLFITGLPLDVFTIDPGKYDLLSPGEKKAFLVEFQGDLEAGTYDIQAVIVSDQGSSFIEGVLIVKELPPEPKLPLAGAAAGLVSQYGKTLLFFILLLILLLAGVALWHLILKTKPRKKKRT